MEMSLENDPIERLRFLLGNFNSLQNNIDMYAQFIKSTIHEKTLKEK